VPRYLATLGSIISILIVFYRLMTFALRTKYQNFMGRRIKFMEATCQKADESLVNKLSTINDRKNSVERAMLVPI